MRTLALLARKGGTGKTTLAVHLAVLAAEAGRRVLLVDTDPQRSAGDWWRVRQSDTPRLVECVAKRTPEVLALAEQDGIDLVVVDTRPSVEADTAEIARLADLVLIPTGAGILDLRAIAATAEMVRIVQAQRGATMIVLNGVQAGSGFGENGLTTEARRALQAYQIPVADVAIGRRVAFGNCTSTWRPFYGPPRRLDAGRPGRDPQFAGSHGIEGGIAHTSRTDTAA
jgi:chromosome partitioning protein